MSSLKELLDSIVVHADKVEDLVPDTLTSIVEEHTVVAIRGLVKPEEIVECKKRIRDRLSVENDNPATGEAPEDLRNNYQKFCLGGGDARNKDFAKCLRTFYNPIWAEDIYGMREPLRKTAQVRNLMMGFDANFAIDDFENGFWTAARIHHYPAGGGFMGIHNENYIPIILEEYGVEAYYQPLIIMSKRGTGPDCDFETGGGFFEKNGERYHYEDETELGDIVIYDTRVMHGVTEIDNHKPFRQDSLAGRLAGFVTMYRDFSKKD